MDRSDLTGILLAGGKSSRMGKEKGLVAFRGKPLAGYGIELLSLFTDRILISSGHPGYLEFGLEIVPDEVSGRGPAAGLASVLKNSRSPWSLVLACDLPFLTPELIEGLIENANQADVVIPFHDGVMEPLCALYRTKMMVTFEEAVKSGNLAIHKILEKCDVYRYEAGALVEQFPQLFTNFNSMEEISRFKD